MAKIEDVLKIARSRIGIKENPPNSNNIDCNTWYYGRPVSGSAYPWCCVEMQFIFHKANASHLIKRTASCSEMAKWFKQNRQFYSTPQVGDLVFYNFHTPSRLSDHIGIVEDVNSDGTIITIEGNTSQTSNDNGGSVMRRHRSSKIVGYGRPAYSDAKRTRATIKMGSKGADVTYLQTRLTSKGYLVGQIDGDFGIKTKNAVMQFQRDVFPDKPKEWDGIVGVNTWKMIEG